MKEKIKEHLKKHEILYSAIFIFFCLCGLVFSNYDLQVTDELFTFANVFKLHNGIQLYSQNNVIDTPLFFYLANAFFSIFGLNFFAYKLFSIVIFEITFLLIINMLKKLNVPVLRAVIYIVLIIFPFEKDLTQGGANYNTLAILFWMLGMNLLVKKGSLPRTKAVSESQNVIKQNSGATAYKFEVLPIQQGIVSALVFATKQNIGIYYLIGLSLFTIYNYRKDIKTIIKKLISTYGVFLIITAIWVAALALQGQFNDFINYCFLGLGEFASNNTRISWENIVYYGIPFLTIFGLIFIKKKFKLTEESKFVKTTIFFLCFMFASLLIGYPIFNRFHIILAIFVSIVYCAYVMEQLVSRMVELFNIRIVKIILIVFIGIVCAMNLYNICNYATKLLNKDYTLTYDNPYFGTVATKEVEETIKQVMNFVELKKENNQNVIIFATEANIYQIALKGNNQDFDLPFLGNWGYNGEERVLNKIKNLKNTFILIKEEDIIGQESTKIKDYIKNNYNKTGEIAGLEIYYIE